MGNVPLTIAVAAGAAILIVILVVIFLKRRRFSGYEEIRFDARNLQSFLKGELFRDIDDLVVTGGSHGFRTTIRFSRAENTPGLGIRMSVPSNLNMMVLPKDATGHDTGAVIRSGSDQLDNRFIVRTEQPTQAKLFLSLNTVLPQMESLCCSSQTYLNIEQGVIELSELTVNEDDLSDHLMAHIHSMAALGPLLGTMPGASDIRVEKIIPPKPVKKYAALIIIAALLVVGLVSLTAYERQRRMDSASSYTGTPVGIPNAEALEIPDLQGWRLANSTDFDQAGVEWLKKSGVVLPSGRIEADFQGTGVPADHAYVLVNADGVNRVVVTTMEPKQVLFDSTFWDEHITLAARVPKAQIAGIPIQVGSAATGQTDGLLLVRQKNNLQSAVVVSFNGSSVISAVPVDYKNIALE